MAGFGVPPITMAASENTMRPAMSTVSMTFCKVFDCSVPAKLSAVSTTTAAAAQRAELLAPKEKISEA